MIITCMEAFREIDAADGALYCMKHVEWVISEIELLRGLENPKKILKYHRHVAKTIYAHSMDDTPSHIVLTTFQSHLILVQTPNSGRILWVCKQCFLDDPNCTYNYFFGWKHACNATSKLILAYFLANSYHLWVVGESGDLRIVCRILWSSSQVCFWLLFCVGLIPGYILLA